MTAVPTAGGPALPAYEVYALRFASVRFNAKDAFLLRGEVHDGPRDLDFYVWVIRGHGRTVVVDMGFGHDACARRKQELLLHPVDALKALDIDPATVRDVVITHLHFDHAGNSHCFPAATFHLQDAEMAFATGRYMRYRALNRATDLDNVLAMVTHAYAGRVAFHDGDDELAPGITLHRIGGHTGGMQVVRVHTERGWIVLASDAAHFYDNVTQDNPFAIVMSIGEVLEGNRRLLQLAGDVDRLVPGHDPLVMSRQPPLPGHEGRIACLHLPALPDAPALMV